ncbi:hypothetical protein JOD67_000529 [Tenggerimyces flavus]|nr:hypothetical protein [Tenggerimyces flavus]
MFEAVTAALLIVAVLAVGGLAVAVLYRLAKGSGS